MQYMPLCSLPVWRSLVSMRCLCTRTSWGPPILFSFTKQSEATLSYLQKLKQRKWNCRRNRWKERRYEKRPFISQISLFFNILFWLEISIVRKSVVTNISSHFFFFFSPQNTKTKKNKKYIYIRNKVIGKEILIFFFLKDLLVFIFIVQLVVSIFFTQPWFQKSWDVVYTTECNNAI